MNDYDFNDPRNDTRRTKHLRREALRAWDNAVASYRRCHGSGAHLSSDVQRRADNHLRLEQLDRAWRAAGLPLPWYPSVLAWPLVITGRYPR